MRKTPKGKIDSLPVNLLLAGRLCLVVGGGRIAARKLGLLLSSGAKVRMVAPKLCPAAEELCATGSVELRRKEFSNEDMDGANLLFAATDNKELNAKLISDGRKRGILCCAVDANWPDGDFITPASFDGGGLKVAVSTGGVSCRRSRLLKESLSRRIGPLADGELLVIGTDHNYLSLSEREPYHLVGDLYEEAGRMLSCAWGLHEFMLLNTCNRVELIAVASGSANLRKLLLKTLGFDRLPEGSYYEKNGMEAFSHLSCVTAGLMSQTPGEKHIVSQLKSAFDTARELGWTGTVMQDWLDATLHVSKHIRTETEPHYVNYEIEDLAFKYIKDTMGLDGANALVVGAGDIGTAMTEMLGKAGCQVSWLYHRNKPEALASESVRMFTMNSLKDKLQDADLIVSAAASAAPLIHLGHAPFLDQSRKVLAIDLGTPRNISHELHKLMPNVKVCDLDDLKHWHRREFVDMSLLFEISSKTIGGHREMYERIVEGLSASVEGGDALKPSGAEADE